MNCDLCGKKISTKEIFSYEAVEGSTLCSSCYEAVSDKMPTETVNAEEDSKLCSPCYSAVNGERSIVADTSTLKCSGCQESVYTFFRIHDDILCEKCFEQRKVEIQLEESTNSYNQASELPPYSVLSRIGSEKSKQTFRNYSIIICQIQYSLALIAYFTYSFNNGAVMDFGGPFMAIIILAAGSVIGFICSIASIINKEESSIGFSIALISHTLISIPVVFVLILFMFK